jgi:PKD repeat protein
MSKNTSLSLGTGGSVFFDGNTDYLTVPNNAAFQFGTGDFTIECWVNTPRAVNSPILDARGAPSAIPYGFFIDVNNFPYFYDGTVYTSSISIVNNTWNHIAVARSSGTLRIYVNGNIGFSSAHAVALNPTSSIFIGGQTWNPLYLNGFISNLRILKGTAVYTGAFTPPSGQLTAITNTVLLTCQNSTIRDASTNNFTITTFGDAAWNSLAPPIVVSSFPNNPFGRLTLSDTDQGSVRFDGTGDFLSIPSNTAFAFGTGDFTVEAWIIRTGGSGIQPICQSDAIGSSTNDKWWFAVNNTGLIFSTHASGGFSVQTTTTFNTGIWYHVAVIRQAGIMSMFINGVNTGFTTGGNPNGYNLSQNGVSIGAISTPYYWTGYISNLRIVKGTAVYTANFTSPTSSLTAIANTSLLTCQGPTIRDASTNNFTITRNGDAVYNNFSPYQPASISESVLESGSIFFDGGSNSVTLPNSSKFNIAANQDFTLEAWVYLSSTRSDYAMMVDFVGDASYILQLRIGNAGFGFRVQATFGPGSSMDSVYNNASYTQTNLLNRWTHLTLCRSGNSATFFFDGVGIETKVGVGSISFSNVNTARLGRPSSELYHGYVSNVRFVIGTALYTSNFNSVNSLRQPLLSNTQLLVKSTSSILWLKDDSVNNFALTPVGSPVYSADTPEVNSQYSSVGSVYFDANGKFLTCGTSSTLALGAGDYTVEMWLYLTAYNASTSVPIEWRTAGNNPTNIPALAIGTTGIPSLYHSIPSGILLSGSRAIPLNSWTHFAMVRSGTTVTMYLNGVNIGSTASGGQTLGIETLRINDPQGLYVTFGYISNFRIVKGTAVYTSSFIPSTAPLTAIPNTVLLTCQGPTIRDASSNNFTITNTGNAKWDASNPFNIVAANINQYGMTVKEFDEVTLNVNSILLNGSAYATIPANNAFILGAGDYTVEAWIYPTTVTGTFTSQIVGTYANPSGDYGWGLGLDTTGKLIFYSYGTTSGVGFLITESGTRITNRWQHVAVTRSGTSINMWVNGVSVASTTSSKNEDFSRSLKIGTQEALNLVPTLGNSGVTFKGNISNLRIVKGTALYTGTFTPPLSALENVSNTSVLLNCLSGQVFNDSSANNFPLTVSAATVSQLSPFSTTVTAQKQLVNGTLLVREFIENTFVDFVASPTSGTSPLTVNFTDISTNAPTSWAWDFDNNGSTDSTSQNTSTTYTTGIYSVKLTATSGGVSESVTKPFYITVIIPPPVVNFTASPTLGAAPLTVNFTDLTTNSPTSWAWDFTNNGSTDSTSQNPSTTYSLPGTYSVKLTATNAVGTGTLTKTSYITATHPVGEQSYTSPGTYTFTVPAGVILISMVCIGGGGGAGSGGGSNGGASSVGSNCIAGGGSKGEDNNGSSKTQAGGAGGVVSAGTGNAGGAGGYGVRNNGSGQVQSGGGEGGDSAPGGGSGSASSAYWGGNINGGNGGGIGLYNIGSNGSGGTAGFNGTPWTNAVGGAGTNGGGGGGGGHGPNGSNVGSSGGAGSGGSGGTYGGGSGLGFGGGAGGGGGAKSYVNDLAVTPGQSLTVTVGAAGDAGAGVGAVRIIWGTGRSFPNNAA